MVVLYRFLYVRVNSVLYRYNHELFHNYNFVAAILKS